MTPSSLSDLKRVFNRGDCDLRALYYPDLSDAKRAVANLQSMGCSVVYTSGVYDMFHPGHAKYLRAARALGDALIVALDTDERVRERKGPKRPVADLDERVHVLSDLRYVDIITLVKPDPDPAHVLKALHPDVAVVSATTQEMTTEVVEGLKPFCGRVEVLPPQSSNSTTARLRLLMIEGAVEALSDAERHVEQAREAIHTIGERFQAESDGLANLGKEGGKNE